jgi:hypothetical protein
MNGDTLCPKCGKRVPKLSLYGHLSVIHGLSHPEIREVTALEEDDSEIEEITIEGYMPMIIDKEPLGRPIFKKFVLWPIIALVILPFSTTGAMFVLALFCAWDWQLGIKFHSAASLDVSRMLGAIEQLRGRVEELEAEVGIAQAARE